MALINHIDDNLDTVFSYPPYYFETATVEKMNDYFTGVLRKIGEGIDVSLDDL